MATVDQGADIREQPHRSGCRCKGANGKRTATKTVACSDESCSKQDMHDDEGSNHDI